MTYQSSLSFPYGYQGQEKDQTTGLTNFELRQYDPRIGRWYNPDPNMQHHSPYLAMSNNPVSFTDPDGGWDERDNPFGGSFFERSTGMHNSDAYGESEFDRKYNPSRARGGSIGADGNYTSNETWIGAAHDTWVSKYGERQSKGQDVAYIPVNPDGSGNLDGEIIAIGRDLSADGQYAHIKNRGQAKDKGFWSNLDDAIGERLFGKQGYSAVKKHGGDNNPYMFTNDELKQAAEIEMEILLSTVPVGEVFQAARITIGGAAKLIPFFSKFQKHHIIPNAIYKTFKPQLKAIGWAQHASINLKKLPIPFHGSHKAYNNFVTQRMAGMVRNGGITVEGMNALQQEMRILVGDAWRSGVGNLNDYFKFMGF